jgi:hypothetical protein
MPSATTFARITAVVAVAAASVLGVVQSAEAASPLYTETTLNQGKTLAESPAGTVIAAPPNFGDSSQRWEAHSRTQVVGGASRFGWELRRPGGTTCIADVGANQRVALRSCDTHSGTNTQSTTQIWQFLPGRQVNGKNYYFWQNAQTGRRLMLDQFSGEGPFPSFTVIASPLKATSGTAAEASQLWNEVAVS